MPQNRKSTILWLSASIIILMALVFSARFIWQKWSLAHPDDIALSVDQVWENAQQLEGQVIRVRGKVEFVQYKTLLICRPPTCECNDSRANFYLVSEETENLHQNCSSKDTIDIPIDCQGDECSLTCSPFDPYPAEALELVGRLKLTYQNGKLCSLALSDLELANSRQMNGGAWKTIPTGSFLHPLVTP